MKTIEDLEKILREKYSLDKLENLEDNYDGMGTKGFSKRVIDESIKVAKKNMRKVDVCSENFTISGWKSRY